MKSGLHWAKKKRMIVECKTLPCCGYCKRCICARSDTPRIDLFLLFRVINMHRGAKMIHAFACFICILNGALGLVQQSKRSAYVFAADFQAIRSILTCTNVKCLLQFINNEDSVFQHFLPHWRARHQSTAPSEKSVRFFSVCRFLSLYFKQLTIQFICSGAQWIAAIVVCPLTMCCHCDISVVLIDSVKHFAIGKPFVVISWQKWKSTCN